MNFKIVFIFLVLVGQLHANSIEPATPVETVEDATITRSIVASDDWQYPVSKAQNAVVQVIAQVAEFNWLQPFKSPEPKQGAGSGFIIDEEGHILTNYHVVEEATSAFVYIPEFGRQYLGVDIIGRCPESDVALLKLHDDALLLVKQTLGKVPTLALGDSDALYHTEPVLALGYPLGQRYIKSTVGEIAGREFREGKVYMHITAPINPGNSGGPLLNKRGEVVGINSAGVPGAQNVGYIVPINDVKIIKDDLYGMKLLSKARLGIGFNNSTLEHAQYLGNPLPSGLFINYVEDGSIAHSMGLQAGDMIYEMNGYKLDHYGDVHVGWSISSKVSFVELLMRFTFGQKLTLVVYRNGERLELSGIIEPRDKKPIRQIFPEVEREEIDYEMFGGMCVMQLRDNHFYYVKTLELAQFARPENSKKNVLVVTNVLPGSIISKVDCIAPGFLIDTVNGESVSTLAELRNALQKSLTTGLVAITTYEKRATVISFEKMLQDEARISQAYMVPITPVVRSLINNYKN